MYGNLRQRTNVILFDNAGIKYLQLEQSFFIL